VFGKKKIKYNPIKTTGHNPTNSAKSCRQAGIYHGNGKWEYDGGVTDRYPVTVLEFNIQRGLHPTQKPVELLEYFIKTYTNENDLVLDNTMGSGTTGVACKNLNRSFIGIEMDDKYFEIAKNRIESHIVQSSLTNSL
jgi:site-specific DNA-methyltransferase (adenine-specific)